jgi:hypothetical protein
MRIISRTRRLTCHFIQCQSYIRQNNIQKNKNPNTVFVRSVIRCQSSILICKFPHRRMQGMLDKLKCLYLFARESDVYRQGLINYTDTKAKCRHLKNLTSKGILRQVFIKVYRMEIHSVMLVFSTQLCELLPL